MAVAAAAVAAVAAGPLSLAFLSPFRSPVLSQSLTLLLRSSAYADAAVIINYRPM